VREAIIRAAADETSEELARLPFGTLMSVIARQGEWVEIESRSHQEVAGWTLAAFLVLRDSPPTREPTPAESATVQAPTAAVTATATEDCVVRPPAGWAPYRIRPGDTLSSIAARGGTSVAELRTVNCLISNTIIAGAVLIVPAAAIPQPGIATATPGPTLLEPPTPTDTPTGTPALLEPPTPTATPVLELATPTAASERVADTATPTATLLKRATPTVTPQLRNPINRP
jgi:LysM repeat protein